VKFLLAGLGSIGRRHLRNLQTLGEKDIVLLRSHHATLPEEGLAGYPVETDLAAALKRHKPDAVIVANPTALHLGIAVPAAKAGCSILIEKPISNSLAHLEELESSLKEQDARLLVGFQFRFHPTLQKAVHLLADGVIGSPLSFHIQWGEYLPDWHPWEDFKQSYSARPELGGGVILTLSHPLDYARMLLGEIRSLWAFTGALHLGLEVEDTAEIGMKMRNGAIGSVHLDYSQQPPSHCWEIVGSNGTMKWDNGSGILEVYTLEKKLWESYPVPAAFERNAMFLDEMKHFIAVVQKKEKPVCTLEDGKRALQVALGALESAKNQKIVVF
jgi:predicted dehydrogenase